MIHFQPTQFGFEWGEAIIERCFERSDGSVCLVLKTTAGKDYQISVSAQGKSVRVFDTKKHVELK